MAGPRKPAPDQSHRDAAVAERRRNVLVDAGAGTGKTTILVDRLVEMVAPGGDGPAVPIGRMAAITFTRKAAGELRLRIRERLLEALAGAGPGSTREARLREALAALDTAYVGTIHSFADRLLRLHPVEADLSPAYEVVDDAAALVHETFEVLMQAVENGTLGAEVQGTPAEARAVEATRAILDALACGVEAGTRDTGWSERYGLDRLVAGFVGARDVPPPDVAPRDLDRAAFRAAVTELALLTTGVRGGAHGTDWLLRVREELKRLADVDDPIEICQGVRALLSRAPRELRKGHDFDNDDVAWQAWQAFDRGKDRERPLADDVRAPLDAWLATRLVRAFPVVVALYDKVKARRRTLDQLDLLEKLRDLLRDKPEVRGEYQRMFDHLFVDEFQDTDPLQAEIVLYLAERGPVASRWPDVVLADGRLTLVGDPKQSIYRFRRADVAMYDRVREVVDRSGPLHVRLAANFRSAPLLIAWLNDRFRGVLGVSPDGRPFDRDRGRVFQQDLLPGREGETAPAVHVLPFDFAGGKHTVDEYRDLEGRALAAYLRWLAGGSGLEIADPLDGRRRRIGYGDVAVLAISTYRLAMLFPHLDTAGIPYASRGGTLFLQDPLNRRFLLGLRALADRDDGIAEAALLRPPFFAVDLLDLLQERAAHQAGRAPAGAGECRARAARDVVRELRRRRFDRPPGATARDLLEHTALGRAVALGANGAQRLARLREVCLVLEQLAAAEGLDFDAATARLRRWVDDPAHLDPPHPVGADAVQVLTVHQAKGLEFPVVVLWDGKGTWDTRLQPAPWRMERDERGGWTMGLETLEWEEPPGLALGKTEKQYLDAERRRVVYVAATRARDLLVVPRAGTPTDKMICHALLTAAPPALVRELPAYRAEVPPAWAREPAVAAPTPADGEEVEREVLARWTAAATEAARPRFQPASVTGEARRDDADESAEPADLARREGRFGSGFGTTVHLALGIVIRTPAVSAEEAVRRAARQTGQTERLAEAAADVARGLATLRAEGLLAGEHAIEYPVAAAAAGRLVSGYVDLVVAGPDWLSVIDFKTDAPPAGPAEATYPEYARQARAYARILHSTNLAAPRRLRQALLFTATGTLHWLPD
jgi:ATP-dependent helicase/nuclease subunit A